MNNREDAFFNAINVAAFILGYENFQQNIAQSAYNDVHAANDKQAKFLLQELDNRFKEQNAILETQTILLNNIYAKVYGIIDRLDQIEGGNKT